jgi:hypothetical protein
MKRLVALLLWFVLSVSIVFSQTAVVTRNVNLRPDPSTGNDPIEKLVPPAQLQLLEPDPTNGFYHVKAGQDEGWVWGRNISIQSGEQPSPPQPQPQPQPTVGGGGLIEPGPVSAISSSWDKGTPENNVFHGDEGDCTETGDGGDADTNKLKNRVDVPPAYHYVTWDAVNGAGYPQGAPRSRANWTQSQLNQITPVEGVAIAVEGYLYKLKVESSSPNASKGGESTNCHAHLANDVDWHMPITAQNGQGEDVAIVLETTPRLRKQHPNWTVDRLKPWTENIGTHANSAFNGQPVRVRGWLMLDPEHQDMINHGLRSTLWEIHPITQIEVFRGGQWVDLDTLP